MYTAWAGKKVYMLATDEDINCPKPCSFWCTKLNQFRIRMVSGVGSGQARNWPKSSPDPASSGLVTGKIEEKGYPNAFLLAFGTCWYGMIPFGLNFAPARHLVLV